MNVCLDDQSVQSKVSWKGIDTKRKLLHVVHRKDLSGKENNIKITPGQGKPSQEIIMVRGEPQRQRMHATEQREQLVSS